MTLEQQKKLWRRIAIVTAILLPATFILLFYSLTVLGGCLEKTIDSETVYRGVCSVPGLRSAARYNWVLVLIILLSTVGLISGIVRSDRIEKELHKDDDIEEPPEEIRSSDAYLPPIHHFGSDTRHDKD